MTPLGWGWAALVWAYAVVWFLFNDRVKLAAYLWLDHHPRGKRETGTQGVAQNRTGPPGPNGRLTSNKSSAKQDTRGARAFDYSLPATKSAAWLAMPAWM